MSASHRKSTQVHARPGQTESQVDPSFQLASTCDSVWPGLKRFEEQIVATGPTNSNRFEFVGLKSRRRLQLDFEAKLGSSHYGTCPAYLLQGIVAGRCHRRVLKIQDLSRTDFNFSVAKCLFSSLTWTELILAKKLISFGDTRYSRDTPGMKVLLMTLRVGRMISIS